MTRTIHITVMIENDEAAPVAGDAIRINVVSHVVPEPDAFRFSLARVLTEELNGAFDGAVSRAVARVHLGGQSPRVQLVQ